MNAFANPQLRREPARRHSSISSAESPALTYAKRNRRYRGFEIRVLVDTAHRTLSSASLQIIMHVGPLAYGEVDDGNAVQCSLWKPGDLSIVPAGAQHLVLFEQPCKSIAVALGPDIVRASAEFSGVNVAEIMFKERKAFRDGRIEQVMWALLADFEAHDGQNDAYARGLGVAVASQAIRSASSPRPNPSNELSRRRINRVIAYIDERLGEQLSIKHLAAAAGLSPTHLKRTFKMISGQALHQYIMNARVEFAIAELLNGSHRLVDLAERAGFADQSHMTRWMKRISGLTPNQLNTRRELGGP